jgi:hypothetical protein
MLFNKNICLDEIHFTLVQATLHLCNYIQYFYSSDRAKNAIHFIFTSEFLYLN